MLKKVLTILVRELPFFSARARAREGDERKKQFRIFIELLNKVRGERKITAKEMREIKDRWLEIEEDREYIFNRLKEKQIHGKMVK